MGILAKPIVTLTGDRRASQLRVAIVSGRWHTAIAERLIESAKRTLIDNGCPSENITTCLVPGTFELPLACHRLALTKNFDALIAVGVLLKGNTDHFRLVADGMARGITDVMLRTGVPIGFGVITADDEESALARAGGEVGDRGAEAALAAIEMASLLQKVEQGVIGVSQ